VTQIDLPTERSSGLIDAIKVLESVAEISINHFSDQDVVRHPIVQQIVKAYDKAQTS
jgi:phosphate starvation-inducible PhoH-like protein